MTITDYTLADTGVGNANPTSSFNVAAALDYSVGMQYIDLMHSMRPWIGHRPTAWGGMDLDDLKDGGYLDENGWPTEIPEGMSKVGTVFGWSKDSAVAEQQAGRYVIKYEGEGELEISGDINIVSRSNGEIVFDNAEGGKWFLNIIKTDPNDNGNYIRNISVVAEEHVELHETGALFNPDWLALIEDSRELRFMDWMGTNGSDMTSWDEMPSADGPNMGTMTPIAHMVQLANETGTDPWFTMPHLADEDFIRQFAEYVHENLDPALTVRVEYSNEMWNWNFPQTSWARDQSFAEWGVEAHRDYYVKKSVETAQIWQEVFGEDADARLVNVLGTQTTNPWFSGKMFEAEIWRANEPENFVDPATVFDELAVTTYFGNGVGKGDQLTALLAAIKDPDVDANTYLYDQMMDPAVSRSIPEIAGFLAQNAAIAQENGVALVAYEGGQHLHHQIRSKEVSEEDLELIGDFMEQFVRSEEMGDLYAELWDVWANVSDGAFMQYNDIGISSQWGSWGFYRGTDDETPRSEVIEELSATTTPWWGAEGGDHYRQGKIVEGSDGADTLIGTSQEDYLVGSAGDDLLVGGAKNDGLHGGDGIDRAVFSGVVDDYIITVEGEGYRVTGPDGSDMLIDVEQISFEDDIVFVLADQTRHADGTLVLGAGVEAPVVIEETEIEADDETDDKTDDETDGGGETEGGEDEVTDEGGKEDEITYVFGSEDQDTLYGSDANEEIRGEGGDDFVYASLGNDSVYGHGGNDILFGGDGDDTLSGGNDDDIVHGGNGSDTVAGGNGNDKVFGNGGNDFVLGGHGDDTVFGNDGDDHVAGQGGDDVLYGGGGNDDLFGGSGNDIINGGTGDDCLSGGGGVDKFTFTKGDGLDAIHGFTLEDEIALGGYFDDCDLATEDRFFADSGNLIITNGVDAVTISGGNDDQTYQYVYDMIF